MEFRFIDNNAPLDRQSQRLVRNHAMKGKNLGKTISKRGHRHKKPRHEIDHNQPTAESASPTVGDIGKLLLPKASRLSDDALLPHNPFSGSELAYFAIDIPPASSVKYLFKELHHSISKDLYPRFFCRQSKRTENTWFDRVVDDPCVFHCAMAVTSSLISQSLGRGGKSLESDRHFLLALRLLRRDLDTKFKPRESNVVVTISLAIYANLRCAPQECRIHLQGLNSILQLRPGGIAALCSSAPEIGNKIRRTDLELALLAGTPIIFRPGQSLPPEPPSAFIRGYNQTRRSTLPHPLDETCPAVQFATADVLSLCGYAGKSQLSAFEYQDLVISIMQHLVDYAPLGTERPLNPLDDASQLGLLAFMSTILYHTREGRPTCSILLSRILWARLEAFNSEFAPIHGYTSFRLWLNFVHAISVKENELCLGAQSSMAKSIKTIGEVLGLITWEDVVAQLSSYPWIPALHDEPGRTVWQSLGP